MTGQHKKKRRQFFDQFAESKNFHPILESEKWYSVGWADIKSIPGGSGVLNYYGSHITAIMKLYPELKLEKKKFLRSIDNDWTTEKARRDFFDNLAKQKGIDPLIPQSWSSVSVCDIKKTKGGSAVLRYYGESRCKALISLYSGLGFNKENLKTKKLKSQEKKI